jgi:hypothetical protein
MQDIVVVNGFNGAGGYEFKDIIGMVTCWDFNDDTQQGTFQWTSENKPRNLFVATVGARNVVWDDEADEPSNWSEVVLTIE